MNSDTQSMNKVSTLPKSLKLKKKNQIEILGMKNSIKEIKNELMSIENRADQMVERISHIKDRKLEMMQREERDEHK